MVFVPLSELEKTSRNARYREFREMAMLARDMFDALSDVGFSEDAAIKIMVGMFYSVTKGE